ncbi:MAG: hypothetical protein KAH20_12025 [Methylococcales bacterium]|nr:hypothetical protein [Methylococcales bacterium]
MQKLIRHNGTNNKKSTMTRRDFLNLSGKIGVASTLPSIFLQEAYAIPIDQHGVSLYNLNDEKNTDWIAEARIGGLSISRRLSQYQLKKEITRFIKQGVTVIEAQSRLSDYLSNSEYSKEMQHIKEITETVHQQGLKIIWCIPALEVITANGVTRQDSFARLHEDWLQVSFDRKKRGVYYGGKIFWMAKTDESAWLCPNTPYREWFKNKLELLATTGVDGIWLDVPIFNQIATTMSCSCRYCQKKFTLQTGLSFPDKYDLSDKSFWQYIRWRHRTITEFLDECKTRIESISPKTVTIADIAGLDHTGATQLGSEGSDLKNIQVIWEVNAISESTAMAEASYDDWIAMHSVYKYCRGATMDRPSWVFSYGYNEADAQLVLASAVAAQNNPYELRTSTRGSSVGAEFRKTQFNWIKRYSKQIFRSRSLASVAVLYSERNRDFLDITERGGMYVSSAPRRDRSWSGDRSSSATELEYLGDYRGLSLLLFQNQIPTDIYPISRVDSDLLSRYSTLVLPSMASLSEEEKNKLLAAINKGSTLIITGAEPGFWDENAFRQKQSIWADILDGKNAKKYGQGTIYLLNETVGQDYLKTHGSKQAKIILELVNKSGAESWVSKKLPIVVQPYVYQQQMLIHILNYSWVGALRNEQKKLKVELTIPWGFDTQPTKIIQTEPQWHKEKLLTYKKSGNKIIISVEVGINAMVLIDLT